jgi:hypothetical protein
MLKILEPHFYVNRPSISFITYIRKIIRYLTKRVTATLVHAFVLCRLDYCNSILHCLPPYQIAKLQSQRVQNAAATDWSVYGSQIRTHQPLYLMELRWLPVKFRIEFKVLILTFQAIHTVENLRFINIKCIIIIIINRICFDPQKCFGSLDLF